MSMTKVDLKNPELLELLHSYSDWFFAQEDLGLGVREERDPEEIDKIVSDEELNNVKNDPNHIGYPLDTRSIPLDQIHHGELGKKAKEVKLKFRRFLGAKQSTLHFYYPENSFISWHTNENCAGKNIILSYSTDGLGFFKFQDPITNEIITIQDEKGWNAKMGEFGPDMENRVWHCARNYGPRITIAYVIDNEALWSDLKEELEDE